MSEYIRVNVLDSKPSGQLTFNDIRGNGVLVGGNIYGAEYYALSGNSNNSVVKVGYYIEDNRYVHQVYASLSPNNLARESDIKNPREIVTNMTTQTESVLTDPVTKLKIYYGDGFVGNVGVYLPPFTPTKTTLIQVLGDMNDRLWGTSSDPFSPGGENETGGGAGDFDNESEDIPIPSLPGLDVTDIRFINLFKVNVAQLNQLSNFLWSDAFDLDSFKKLFSDPMEAILGIIAMPLSINETLAQSVTIGNIDTGLTFPSLINQFVDIDCGTININEYWGSYLDYNPFTTIEIYLPFISFVRLNVDEVMNKSINLRYRFDLLSGACVAFISVNNSCIYQFAGQCAVNIPISSSNFTQIISSVISISVGTLSSAVAGGMIGGGVGAAVGGVSSFISSSANAITNSKEHIESKGNFSSNLGIMGQRTPFIKLTRPRQALPPNQNQFIGYPSFITTKLKDVKGYTQVYAIHLDNIQATDNEKQEIERLLKEGVIL